MTQHSQVRNPFMLMLQPEVVLAAIENSERLGRLSRRLCRPLDHQGQALAGAGSEPDMDTEIDDSEDSIGSESTN